MGFGASCLQAPLARRLATWELQESGTLEDRPGMLGFRFLWAEYPSPKKVNLSMIMVGLYKPNKAKVKGCLVSY